MGAGVLGVGNRKLPPAPRWSGGVFASTHRRWVRVCWEEETGSSPPAPRWSGGVFAVDSHEMGAGEVADDGDGNGDDDAAASDAM